MAQVKVQDISTYLCSFLQYYGQGLHHLLKPHKFVSLNLRAPPVPRFAGHGKTATSAGFGS